MLRAPRRQKQDLPYQLVFKEVHYDSILPHRTEAYFSTEPCTHPQQGCPKEEQSIAQVTGSCLNEHVHTPSKAETQTHCHDQGKMEFKLDLTAFTGLVQFSMAELNQAQSTGQQSRWSNTPSTQPEAPPGGKAKHYSNRYNRQQTATNVNHLRTKDAPCQDLVNGEGAFWETRGISFSRTWWRESYSWRK